jgi:hydrogenase maturation factor
MPERLVNEILNPGKLPGALLAHLLGGLPAAGSDIIVGPGIGRDAAAVRIGDSILVLKSDPITFASRGAARYLVSINSNDLACLGATPKWMLVTGMFPVGTTRAEIQEMFAELADVTTEAGIALVGGHTEITSAVNRPVLVGMLAGESTEPRLLKPGNAVAGDLLVVSQPIAIEGTALLAQELEAQLTAEVGREVVMRAQTLLDRPGLSVARDAELAFASADIHAMHDPTEGGISTGAREIAEASGLAAQVHLDRIPVMPETSSIANALGINPIGMLASGSLLVAVPKQDVRALLTAWENAGAQPSVIGRLISAEAGHQLIDGVETRELPAFEQDEVSRALTRFTG